MNLQGGGAPKGLVPALIEEKFFWGASLDSTAQESSSFSLINFLPIKSEPINSSTKAYGNERITH